jgi:hypothetical protein
MVITPALFLPPELFEGRRRALSGFFLVKSEKSATS